MLAIWLGALVVLGAAPTAHAAPPPAGAECLSSSTVLVLVVDETGKKLSEACADAPTSGSDALKKAGIDTTLTPGQPLICTIAKHPATCPTKYAGQYWSYWTGTPGKPWTYATKGPGESKPALGTIEGWCYTPKVAEAEQATLCARFLNAVVNPATVEVGTDQVGSSTASPSSSQAGSASATPPAPCTGSGCGDPGGGSVVPSLIASGIAIVAGLTVVIWVLVRRRRS